jgi:hypothetical protein
MASSSAQSPMMAKIPVPDGYQVYCQGEWIRPSDLFKNGELGLLGCLIRKRIRLFDLRTKEFGHPPESLVFLTRSQVSGQAMVRLAGTTELLRWGEGSTEFGRAVDSAKGNTMSSNYLYAIYHPEQLVLVKRGLGKEKKSTGRRYYTWIDKTPVLVKAKDCLDPRNPKGAFAVICHAYELPAHGNTKVTPQANVDRTNPEQSQQQTRNVENFDYTAAMRGGGDVSGAPERNITNHTATNVGTTTTATDTMAVEAAVIPRRRPIPPVPEELRETGLLSPADIDFLGLETIEQQCAFILVGGYHAGDGSVSLYRQQRMQYVTFGTVKDYDDLRTAFDSLGLVEGIDYNYRFRPAVLDGPMEKRRPAFHLFGIKTKRWLDFYGDSLAHRYGTGPGSRTFPSSKIRYMQCITEFGDFIKPLPLASGKGYPAWVWQLTHPYPRRLFLEGDWYADGCSAPNGKLSSRTFRFSKSGDVCRDHVQMLGLEAGFSGKFHCMNPKGDTRIIALSGCTVTATDHAYAVYLRESARAAEPRAYVEDGNIEEITYTGDIFTFEVPVGYAICIRKVPETGRVTKAGLPVLAGPIGCAGDGLESLVVEPAVFSDICPIFNKDGTIRAPNGTSDKITLEQVEPLKGRFTRKDAAAELGVNIKCFKLAINRLGIMWPLVAREYAPVSVTDSITLEEVQPLMGKMTLPEAAAHLSTKERKIGKTTLVIALRRLNIAWPRVQRYKPRL